jgi:integration host factor subunit beta
MLYFKLKTQAKGKAMVKSELILKLSEKQTMLSVKDVELGVNLIIEKMSQSLAGHDRIEIRGFGSFSLHYRPPRRAHNPKTGARVFTEAKYTPHFKPGKELRERVNASQATHPITDGTSEEDE